MMPTNQRTWDRLRAFLTSIRFKLTLWFVAILGVVLLVFSVVIYTQQARGLQRDAEEGLERMLNQIRTSEEISSDEAHERRTFIPNLSQNSSFFLQDNEVLAVTDLQAQVVQKYGPISDGQVGQVIQQYIRLGESSRPFTYALAYTDTNNQKVSQKYAFLVSPVSYDEGGKGYLLLGNPVDPGGQLNRLLLTLIFAGIGTLGVALAGGYLLADRAMRPVKTITQAARQISETDLSRRLNLDTQDEIGQLAQTFDQMLARLQAAFNRQRQFTADASHELRTPLTIINLETDRALSAPRSTEEYRRALGIIQSENELMSRLVNNLLTLSRMDAGQTQLEMQPLDLSDVALEVVERMTQIAQRHGVSLSSGALPEVLVAGDRQYLNQMITNLIENAIKYSRGEDKQVRVDTGIDRQAQEAVGWVKVTDNGQGISPEHLAHLFDRFYQVDQARSRASGESSGEKEAPGLLAGSGLGLSIVQWIAQAHGGQVVVQSDLGQGSVFEVRLPLLENSSHDS
jgi:signal transduction histidine kinase